MSTFVEVFDVSKETTVIINLDCVTEVAPLRGGGCELFFQPAGVNSRLSIRVKENYDMFKQFAMQTVSSDMIKEKVAKLKG